MAYDSNHTTVECSECGASHKDYESIDHYSRCSSFKRRRPVVGHFLHGYIDNTKLSEADVERIAKRTAQLLGKL